MKINKISKDIYEIEDFLTEEQQEKVLNFVQFLKEEDWWNKRRSQPSGYNFWGGKTYVVADSPPFREVYLKILNLYDNFLEIPDFPLQRYKTGDSLGRHRDYHLFDEKYHVRYGIVIYFNDDYEGGELEYPELNIVHKPKARSLIMHGGNILHGTLPVISNSTRYFATCFVRGSKESPVILNQQLFKGIEENDGSEYR